MRVIAGKYKSRVISMPRDVRPTSNKVREAIFDVFSTQIEGASVLDLFAGSGGFGIEAISQGAASSVFCDKIQGITKIIRKNLQVLDPQDIKNTEVMTKDALGAIKSLHNKQVSFDIIFLDPPYYKNWIRKCLKYISIYDILTHSGFIIAEHSKKDKINFEEESFTLMRQLTYGDTIISILKKKAKK